MAGGAVRRVDDRRTLRWVTCMTPSEASEEIEAVAAAAFAALRAMDAACPTGLSNYVSMSPYAGMKRKDEAAIVWGLTNALALKWNVPPCERRYPQSRARCDRVVELSEGSRLWLEIKLAWRVWFYEKVKWNHAGLYSGYLGGAHHSHSAAGDFTKLERIGPAHGRYAALLLIGYDGADGQMCADMASLAARENLQQRCWQLRSDMWATAQSPECWNRCWFGWRATR